MRTERFASMIRDFARSAKAAADPPAGRALLGADVHGEIDRGLNGLG
jgi:hypothetical protein